MPKQTSIKLQADGITFDSRPEYNRYQFLKGLLDAGTITNLTVHPEYVIQGAFDIPATPISKKRHIRDIRYTPDFMYIHRGIMVIEDVKGKGAGGKPFMQDTAKLRHKVFQHWLMTQNTPFVFNLVTIPDKWDF